VSLVLEALKKLDREKGRAERGFVVMAATPWPARAARRWPVWAAALVVASAVGAWAVISQRRAGPAAPGTAPVGTGAAAAVPDVAAMPAARIAPALAVDVTRPARAPVAAVAPPPAAEHGAGGLRLQAISARDGQPVAIINDHLVRIGDEFDGVRVLAIREAEVDVEVRGQRATLRF